MTAGADDIWMNRQYVRSIVDRDVPDAGRVRDADGVARLRNRLHERVPEDIASRSATDAWVRVTARARLHWGC